MQTLTLTLDYAGAPVRVVGTPDRPEWIAADVCRVLGLNNSRKAVADFDDDERGVTTSDTLGGRQTVVTVSEAGLYRLILRSRKAEAKAFRRWLFHEVLPSIHRFGCYPPPESPLFTEPGLFGPMMPDGSTAPAYRLDRITGEAIVTVAGRELRLGTHGTPESMARYNMIVAAWSAMARAGRGAGGNGAPILSLVESVRPSTSLMPLRKLASIPWLPRPVSIATAFRWHRHGLRGTYLETIRCGGRLFTSESAVFAFLYRVAMPVPPSDKLVHRLVGAITGDRTAAILDAAGIS